MQFLTIDDLKAHSFERYIDESKNDFTQSLDTIERQNIAKIKSKLNGRFDVDAIFEATGTNRDDLIIQVLTFLVLGELIGRNKARKVPEDIMKNYKWALGWLDDVRNNKEHPELPVKTDDEGNPIAVARWGNNRTDNFYL